MSRSSLVSSGPPLAFLVPALGGLVVLGLLIGLIGGGRPEPAAAEPDASHVQIVAGQPSGTVVATPSPSATASPSNTPSPTSSPEPSESPEDEETPEPKKKDGGDVGAGGFAADVHVCHSVSGSRCNGEFASLSSGARSFWVLVRFENSSRGDVIGTRVEGPSGTIDTEDFTVGGGDGYAWTQVGGRLAAGSYTVVAERNGNDAAETTFSVE